MFETKFVEKPNTHFMTDNIFQYLAIREIMLKNVVQPEKPEFTI